MTEWKNPAFVYPASALPIRSDKLIVEVGPGRGDFLFHLAETHPHAKIVGIEIKHKRVDKLIKRIEHRGLKNVAVIQDDARKALPDFFADATVDEIHILFPDPWPKRKHEKNRAINYSFLEECRRALKPQGTINFATDHRRYADTVSELFTDTEGFESCRAQDAYPTFFAQKWIAEGRAITIQKYRRL